METANLPVLASGSLVDGGTGEVLVGEVVGEGFDPSRWDDNVELCRQKAQEIRDNQLVIGAIAENVVRRWGRGGDAVSIMRKFANKVGIAVSTLYEYRRVHKAFPDGGPAELDYTGLRTAVRAGTKNGEHLEAAQEAAEQGLTSRSMERRRVEREQDADEHHGAAEDVTGKTRVCPACGGSGKCSSCGTADSCTACSGSGEVPA